MTHSYCTESIASQLTALGLPFPIIFARALVALLVSRKISLHHVASLMSGEQNAEANRMQLRRCLDHDTLTSDTFARTLAPLLPRAKWVLALDRTEWRRGTTTVNLLVLAVVAYGCAVPLLWSVLPDCGASDTNERQVLLQRFLLLFGKERVRFLTADREFIGFEWVNWLLVQQIPFRIRIKASEYLQHIDGREQKARDWFLLRACRCKPHPMQLWGLGVYVGGKQLRGAEFLVVISNEPGDLLADYRLRWKIETLFQALKGRGFDLESCRLSQPGRLGGWFGFLALGLCWCLKVGHGVDAAEPLPLKAHGRRAVSIFRRGLERLQALLACLAGSPRQDWFAQAVDKLSPNYLPV